MAHDYGTVRYWVDDFGTLWSGPTSPDSTMHYGTFEGYTITTDTHEPIWVQRRSEAPSGACYEEISYETAQRVMELFRAEAIAEKRRIASKLKEQK